MNKLYVAFELNQQEAFETERHRAVFFHPSDPDKVWYVVEMKDIAALIRRVKNLRTGHDLVLLDHGFKGHKVVPSGRWGLAKVLELYGSKS
jgi:hypothetical protein